MKIGTSGNVETARSQRQPAVGSSHTASPASASTPRDQITCAAAHWRVTMEWMREGNTEGEERGGEGEQAVGGSG